MFYVDFYYWTSDVYVRHPSAVNFTWFRSLGPQFREKKKKRISSVVLIIM